MLLCHAACKALILTDVTLVVLDGVLEGVMVSDAVMEAVDVWLCGDERGADSRIQDGHRRHIWTTCECGDEVYSGYRVVEADVRWRPGRPCCGKAAFRTLTGVSDAVGVLLGVFDAVGVTLAVKLAVSELEAVCSDRGGRLRCRMMQRQRAWSTTCSAALSSGATRSPMQQVATRTHIRRRGRLSRSVAGRDTLHGVGSEQAEARLSRGRMPRQMWLLREPVCAHVHPADAPCCWCRWAFESWLQCLLASRWTIGCPSLQAQGRHHNEQPPVDRS